MVEREGDDSIYGDGLIDRAKGLVVVNSRALSEALKDPTYLILIQGTISLELMLEDPLVGDHMVPGARHQVPLVVGHQCLIFLLHCATPMGSASALRTKDGICEGGRVVAAMSTSQSMRWRTPTDCHVTIGWRGEGCSGRRWGGIPTMHQERG